MFMSLKENGDFESEVVLLSEVAIGSDRGCLHVLFLEVANHRREIEVVLFSELG